MRKFVSFGIFVALAVMLSLAQAAELDDGDASLCTHPWQSGSQSSGPGGVEETLTISSQCGQVDTRPLRESAGVPLRNFLDEVTKDLWDSGRLPRDILYSYTLRIDNDGPRNISLNLSDWQVIHSPYTQIARDFTIAIPRCRGVLIKFLSPWPPKLRESPVNLLSKSLTNPSAVSTGEWYTEGVGAASIVVPVWYQFFSEGMEVVRLSPHDPRLFRGRTEACSGEPRH